VLQTGSEEVRGRMRNSHQETLENPAALLSRAVSKLNSVWMAWTYPFASIGERPWMHHSCQLSRSVANHIRLGASVALDSGVWLDITGAPDRHQTVIILEDGCKIGKRCVISAKNQVHVGRNTIFAPSVVIVDHAPAFEDVTLPISRQGTRGGTIRIEEGCWIGCGAVVMCDGGELVIGRNSVVAANAVVTRTVPPYSLAAGNPAKIVKQYDASERKWVLRAV
jgi:acetyltransferase-like isoleucine patch superfamily enzyme